MSQEWLDIQSFVTDQKLLAAINDLSIAVKLELAGVRDAERHTRASSAREFLKIFLSRLGAVVRASTHDVVGGIDPRLKDLADAFALARHDSTNYRSSLIRIGLEGDLRIFDAADLPAKKELLQTLADLRRLVSRHQQLDAASIFEDF